MKNTKPQTRITIPVTVEHIEVVGDLQAISLRELARHPDAAEHYFVQDRRRKSAGPFDPWRLRQLFLSWPVEQWETFVFMAGQFSHFRLSHNAFAEWQELLRAALITPPRKWKNLNQHFDSRKVRRFLAPLRFRDDWDSDVPSLRIVATDSLTAMIATVRIDRYQNAEFRVCARPDCKSAPFRVEPRHKIYCGSDCAHLVAVRNSRAGGKKSSTRGKTSGVRRGA